MAVTELSRLAEVVPEVANAFRQLRGSVLDSGPLGKDTVELIVVATLACTGRHGALRVHIKRLLDMGVDRATISHALVASLGAATTLTETVDGLAVLAECAQGGDK